MFPTPLPYRASPSRSFSCSMPACSSISRFHPKTSPTPGSTNWARGTPDRGVEAATRGSVLLTREGPRCRVMDQSPPPPLCPRFAHQVLRMPVPVDQHLYAPWGTGERGLPDPRFEPTFEPFGLAPDH